MLSTSSSSSKRTRLASGSWGSKIIIDRADLLPLDWAQAHKDPVRSSSSRPRRDAANNVVAHVIRRLPGVHERYASLEQQRQQQVQADRDKKDRDRAAIQLVQAYNQIQKWQNITDRLIMILSIGHTLLASISQCANAGIFSRGQSLEGLCSNLYACLPQRAPHGTVQQIPRALAHIQGLKSLASMHDFERVMVTHAMFPQYASRILGHTLKLFHALLAEKMACDGEAQQTSSLQLFRGHESSITPQKMLKATRPLARRDSISPLLNSVASLLDDRPLADRTSPSAMNSAQYVCKNSAALVQVIPLSIPFGIVARSPPKLV